MDARMFWRCYAVLLIAAVALLFGRQARAEGTVDPSGTSQYSTQTPGGQTGWYGDPGSSCAAASVDPSLCTSSYHSCGVVSYTSTQCTTTRIINSPPGPPNAAPDVRTWGTSSRPGNSCPSNATLSADGSTCTCNATYTPSADHKSCVPPQPPKCADVAAGMSGTYYAAGAKSVGYMLCVQGCSIVASVGGFDSNGAYFAGPFRPTGGTCTGAGTGTNNADPPKPSPNPLPDPPKPGYCPGSINNVPVPGGVPCSGGTASAGTTGGTTPDTTAPGSSNGTATSGTDPGNSTVCKSGTCTTTSTSGNATGGGGGAVCNNSAGCTVSQTKDQYCAANPGSAQCKDKEGSFGGSCAAGFTCSGDAVQCAMAQKQYQTYCELTTESTDMANRYAGLTGTGVAPSAGDTTVNVGSSLPAPPPDSCALVDSTIQVGPMTLAFPLGTYMCPKLFAIKAVIVAFGSLLWVLIVVGIKGGK